MPSRLDVELYELLHTGNPGDVDYYRRICDGAGSVLELGCGFGRITLPLLADGHYLTALDIHPGMLERLQQRVAGELGATDRLVTVCDDMRRFALERTFDRILIPYNTFYCLPSDRDCLTCLANVRRHLNPGGLLVLDGYCVDDPPSSDEESEEEPLVQLFVDQRSIMVFHSARWRAEPRLVVATYRFSESGGGQTEQRITHHYHTPEQLRALISNAGFVNVNSVRAFADGEDEQLVVSAMNPR